MNNIKSAWISWALFEGLARAASITTVALVGLSFSTFADSLFATLIIGLVQMMGAAMLAKWYGTSLWLGGSFFLWSVLFGVFAVAATLLGFLVLGALGGDLAVYVFIVVGLSIVPGALIDRIFFGVRLSLSGWLGVGIAIVGGYVMLGFPDLKALALLPSWVLLSFLGTCTFAANRGITRHLVQLSSGAGVGKTFVQNTVVGIATVLLCAAILLIVSFGAIPTALSSGSFWTGSILIGVFVLILVGANFMSFERGANIAVKETLSTGTFLFLSAVAGVLLLAEPFTWNKVAGMSLYIVAFYLLQKGRR